MSGTETYRILIEGIGSIGGVIAGKLIRAGYQPTLVTGNPQITDRFPQRMRGGQTRKAGIRTPLNQCVTRMIKEIEEGRRRAWSNERGIPVLLFSF